MFLKYIFLLIIINIIIACGASSNNIKHHNYNICKSNGINVPNNKDGSGGYIT